MWVTLEQGRGGSSKLSFTLSETVAITLCWFCTRVGGVFIWFLLKSMLRHILQNYKGKLIQVRNFIYFIYFSCITRDLILKDCGFSPQIKTSGK